MDIPVTRDLASDLVWPRGGVTRVPFRVFSDPAIYAEEQKRLFPRADLEFSVPGDRDSQSRRLASCHRWRNAGCRHTRRTWRDPRVGQSLRAQGGTGVPAGTRQREGADLRVSFVELRSRRAAAERCVPSRRPRQGRHAGGFRQRAASAGAAACRSVLRAGIRHVLGCDEAGGRVSRRDDGAYDPPQSRPAAPVTRHAQPDHPQQLEALRGERAQLVSRRLCCTRSTRRSR